MFLLIRTCNMRPYSGYATGRYASLSALTQIKVNGIAFTNFGSVVQMKLEKERSYSTDKILNKLKLAQMKAQEMRISISAKQGQQLPKTAHKAAFFHKHGPMSSFRSCFTCHHT